MSSSRPPLLLGSALVFGGVAVISAFVGLGGHIPDLASRVFAAAGTLAFQLPSDAPASVWLTVARIAATLAGVTAVFGILLEVSPRARDGARRMWFRTRPSPAVVVGLGRVGMQLMRDLRKDGRPVYAVEVDARNPRVDEAREAGALVVIGDVTTEATRESLPLNRTAEVFVVTGDDVRNLEVAGVLLEGVTTNEVPPPSPGEPEGEPSPDRAVYVHAGSATVLAAAEQQGLLPHRRGGTAFRLFSVLAEGAVDLMEQLHQRHAPGDGEAAHYVLLGFGEVGQSVALGMARLAHFPNRRRLRLTVIHGPEEREGRDRFLALHPAFCPELESCSLDGLTGVHGAEADRWDWFDKEVRPARAARARSDEHPGAVEYAVNAEFVERVAPVSGDTIDDLIARFRRTSPTVRPAVVVAFDDEHRNARVAVGLHDRLRATLAWPPDPPRGERSPPFSPPPAPTDGLPTPVPLFVYQFSEDGLRPLLAPPPDPAQELDRAGWFRKHADDRYPICLFGLQKQTASYKAVTQPDRRERGGLLHQTYERLSGHGRVEVSRAFDRSNLDSALLNRLTLQREFEEVPRDAPGAIRLLPLADDGGEAVEAMIDEFTVAVGEELAEALAEMEHNRWMAERLVTGWHQGERSDAGRRRETFLAWSDKTFTDGDRRYDRAQIPQLLLDERQNDRHYRLRTPRPFAQPPPPSAHCKSDPETRFRSS